MVEINNRTTEGSSPILSVYNKDAEAANDINNAPCSKTEGLSTITMTKKDLCESSLKIDTPSTDDGKHHSDNDNKFKNTSIAVVVNKQVRKGTDIDTNELGIDGLISPSKYPLKSALKSHTITTRTISSSSLLRKSKEDSHNFDHSHNQHNNITKYEYKKGVSFDTLNIKRKAETFSLVLREKHKDFVYSNSSRTFLIGIDDTLYSLDALQWLLDEFVNDGDEVVCIHAIKSRINITNMNAYKELEPVYRNMASKILKEILAINKDNKKISVVLELTIGSLRKLFKKYTNLYNASIIVVGTKSGGCLKKVFSRSLSRYCVQNARIPVIVVDDFNNRYKKKSKRISDPKRQSFLKFLCNHEKNDDQKKNTLLENTYDNSISTMTNNDNLNSNCNIPADTKTLPKPSSSITIIKDKYANTDTIGKIDLDFNELLFKLNGRGSDSKPDHNEAIDTKKSISSLLSRSLDLDENSRGRGAHIFKDINENHPARSLSPLIKEFEEFVTCN